MTLSWDPVPGASGYQIFYGATVDAITTPVGTSSGPFYTITGLTAATTYYFKVIAVDAFGESLGTETQAMTPALLIP
ncbi:MAG: hypothetical protein CVV55_04285 [Synergistetes bacterium HGW-Synergistetes-2]|nr:MAG: hypothetical protein CVV55_04285 [Synergistetes bacterium HGW-Synergistetes-2]